MTKHWATAPTNQTNPTRRNTQTHQPPTPRQHQHAHTTTSSRHPLHRQSHPPIEPTPSLGVIARHRISLTLAIGHQPNPLGQLRPQHLRHRPSTPTRQIQPMRSTTKIVRVPNHRNRARHLVLNQLPGSPINDLPTSRLDHIGILVEQHVGTQINPGLTTRHPLTTRIRNLTSGRHQRTHELPDIDPRQISRIKQRPPHPQRHTIGTPPLHRRLPVNSRRQRTITHRHIMENPVAQGHIHPRHIRGNRRSTEPPQPRMTHRSLLRSPIEPIGGTHLTPHPPSDRSVHPAMTHIHNGTIAIKVTTIMVLGHTTNEIVDEEDERIITDPLLLQPMSRPINSQGIIDNTGLRQTPHRMQRQNHRPWLHTPTLGPVMRTQRHRINNRHRNRRILPSPRRSHHRTKNPNTTTKKTNYPDTTHGHKLTVPSRIRPAVANPALFRVCRSIAESTSGGDESHRLGPSGRVLHDPAHRRGDRPGT